MLEARAIHTGQIGRHHLMALAQTHGIGRARVEEMIELVGLTDVARKRAGGSRSGWASGWESPRPFSVIRRRDLG